MDLLDPAGLDGRDQGRGAGKPAGPRRCPICRKPADEHYRPFCSKRSRSCISDGLSDDRRVEAGPSSAVRATSSRLRRKALARISSGVPQGRVDSNITVTGAFAGSFQDPAKGQEIAKEAVEFSKGNLEAMVEAGKIAAKGGEAIAQDLAAYAKQSFTDTTAAAKRYAEVKTPADFFQLQTELTKTAFDTMVKQGSKTTELSVKLANDAFQPISNRIALAVSKLKSAA